MHDYQTLFIERKKGKKGREEGERREKGRKEGQKEKKKKTCNMPSSSTARMARTLKT